jgi:hypothetical protein
MSTDTNDTTTEKLEPRSRVQKELSEVRRLHDLEEERAETFREEVSKYENGEIDSFDETRRLVNEQVTELQDIKRLLKQDTEFKDKLEERTEKFKTDYAIRHREEALKRLDAHITILEQYVRCFEEYLAVFENNLRKLENGIDIERLQDITPFLTEVEAAIEGHDEEVEALDRHMTVLAAFFN